jgi:WD40 repeat protein
VATGGVGFEAWGGTADRRDTGKTVVSGSLDHTLKVWDVETGTCLASFMGDAPFHTVALSETMRVFAGDTAGRVHLLELRLDPDLLRRPHSQAS